LTKGETSEIYANNRDQHKSCGFAYAFDPHLIWGPSLLVCLNSAILIRKTGAYRLTPEVPSVSPNGKVSAFERNTAECLRNLCFHLLKLLVSYRTPFSSFDQMVQQDLAPVSFTTGSERLSR
jgi:hypothetical protein